MDCHHTPSDLQYLVWNRSNFCRIGLKGLVSMIWWCDCGTSLSPRLLWNADVLPTPGCIRKCGVSIQWERGHDTAYKMAMTFGMKRKIMDCKFPIVCICHVTSICHIKFMGAQRVVWGLPHECVMTYWDHGERVFHLSVLPLVFSTFDMWHKAWTLKWVHSLHDRKAVTSELCLLPIFFISDSYLKCNLQGK